jgi:cation:H+ antiporter
MLYWLYVVGGGVALTLGSDWIIQGAAGLALALGVAPLIVGLTIVSYGTSAPELVIGIGSSLEGHSAIAVSNSVGSNLANLGLILGLTALLHPPRVDGGLLRRELPVLALSTLVVPLLGMDGQLGRVDGAVLLALGAAYVVWTLRGSLGSRAVATRNVHRWRSIGLTLVGLILLMVGGKLFVDGSVGVARAFGISERAIGLTLVSVGTSLPELATSIFASLRAQPSIAVGTLVGSNIFNMFFILGAASLAHPLPFDLQHGASDWLALGAVTLLAVGFMRSERRLSRLEGALFISIYAAWVATLLV